MAEPFDNDYDDDDMPQHGTNPYAHYATHPPINPPIAKPVAALTPALDPITHLAPTVPIAAPAAPITLAAIFVNPWIVANLTKIKEIWDTCTPLTSFDMYEEVTQVAILEFALAIYQQRANPSMVQQPATIATKDIREYFMLCIATNNW